MESNCAGCHQPQLGAEVTSDGLPVVPGGKPNPPDPVSRAAGLKFYHLRLFDVDKIGTDPKDAVNFAMRYADATAMGLSANEWGPNVIYPVISGIMATYYKNHDIPLATQQCWNGERSNFWRAPKAYPAPPPPTCACQPTTSGYVCPPPAWFQSPGSASPPAGWPQNPGGASPPAGTPAAPPTAKGGGGW